MDMKHSVWNDITDTIIFQRSDETKIYEFFNHKLGCRFRFKYHLKPRKTSYYRSMITGHHVDDLTETVILKIFPETNQYRYDSAGLKLENLSKYVINPDLTKKKILDDNVIKALFNMIKDFEEFYRNRRYFTLDVLVADEDLFTVQIN